NVFGGADDTLTLTTTTTATGVYSFTDVAPAIYGVVFTIPNPSGGNADFALVTQAVGGDNTIDSDPDPVTGQTAPLTITSGATINNIDASYTGTTSVTGYTFEDVNGDGIQDASDLDIENVPVTVTHTISNVYLLTSLTLNATTDPSGVWSVDQLPGGAFDVQYGTPSGYVVTQADATGTPSLLDSDGLGTGLDQLSAQNLVAGTDEERDQGFYVPVDIQGRVRFDRDLDQNLYTTDAEPGVQGVTVTLLVAGSPILTTTTDVNGDYVFDDAPPGTFGFAFVNPDATNFEYEVGPLSDNDVAALDGADGLSNDNFTYSSGDGTVDGADAAIIGRSTISGVTFEDLDGDGQREAGEDASGLPDNGALLTVTVNLPNRLTTTITRTALITDGVYSFPGLPGAASTSAVDFTVAFTSPTGFVPTFADIGAPATDSDGPGTAADQLDAQAIAPSTTAARDQGYYAPIVISAGVFEEDGGADVDNTIETLDTPIAGVTVTLEISGSGTFVAAEVTDATGLVTFTVAPGSYQLNVSETAAALVGLLAAPGQQDPTLAVGSPFISGDSSSFSFGSGDNSFGFYAPASVTGTVYFDRNFDDLKAGEPGLQNVQVALVGPQTYTTTTDVAGGYSFSQLVPGSYTLTMTNPDTTNFSFIGVAGDSDLGPAGANTTAADALTVGYASTTSDQDAGMIGRSSVGGSVVTDTNGDGNLAAEPALDGVTVALTVNVNLPNLITTTINRTAVSSSGTYSFAGLLGGGSVAESNFDLSFVTPAGATPTLYDVTAFAPTNDNDGPGTAADQLDDQALAKNISADRDQGFYVPVDFTGTVAFDRDADNDLFADAEPGMSGVQVVLQQGSAVSGTRILTTTTDATGVYTFIDVAPGTYRVRVINPDIANFTFPATVSGDNDVSLNGSDGLTAAVNAASGDPLFTNDAAVLGRSSVSGRVFEDPNADGGQADAIGLGGVTIDLTVTVNLPGLLTTTINATATSAVGTGVYTFTNLPGGATVAESSFDLSFGTPAGYLASPSDVAAFAPTNDSDGNGTAADQLDDQALAKTITADRDRGYFLPVTITAGVFEEDGGGTIDNVIEALDTPIVGVSVTLEISGTGAFVAEEVTDASGLVTFTVSPGSYQLDIDETSPALVGLLAAPGQEDPAIAVGSPLTSGEASGFSFNSGDNSFGFSYACHD
ncbi:hypothetical protein HC891_07950, partial [Candidatus Gracilibacteria bacterium]|nr:hypothetical protein [Candidatus Gracilibacteria bacterium]